MTPLATALSALLALSVLLGAGGGWYLYQGLEDTRTSLASTTEAYQATKLALASSTELADNLYASLTDEQRRNGDFQDQIEDLNDTVDELDKLANTDPELLDKYSKVFFLSDNYAPKSLTGISDSYLYDPSRDLQFEKNSYYFLRRLMEAAEDDDVDLKIASAYRSFGTQATLKAEYKVVYGSGANAFSADQGYSEHQLGTAVDFTTESLKGGLDGFDRTPAYAWLQKNAYKYGFVISYPKGNAYYQYEPWHWRFVGKDLADDLRDDGKYFYDLDQRTIDSYLIDIFDR
jgi:LAS superfamily LD-carboxypeptidase LdcB